MTPPRVASRGRILPGTEQQMRSVSTNSVLALTRKDLACYCVARWPHFELAAHHRIIAEKLEGVERGELRRLILSCPVRAGLTKVRRLWRAGRPLEAIGAKTDWTLDSEVAWRMLPVGFVDGRPSRTSKQLARASSRSKRGPNSEL